MATIIRHIEALPTTNIWFGGNDLDGIKQLFDDKGNRIRHRGG